jgi:hypothetical protein
VLQAGLDRWALLAGVQDSNPLTGRYYQQHWRWWSVILWGCEGGWGMAELVEWREQWLCVGEASRVEKVHEAKDKRGGGWVGTVVGERYGHSGRRG